MGCLDGGRRPPGIGLAMFGEVSRIISSGRFAAVT
jgi:hypothetical protein